METARIIDFRIDCYDVNERRLRHLRAAAARAGVSARVHAVTASHLRNVALAARGYSIKQGANTKPYASADLDVDADTDEVYDDDDDGDDVYTDVYHDVDDDDDGVARAHVPYDAVLVDVPCSSTGALRRFPSLRWEMDENKIAPTAMESDPDTTTRLSMGEGNCNHF